MLGFFRYAISIDHATNDLRSQIKQQNEADYPILNPYLDKIDEDLDFMKVQYENARQVIDTNLSEVMNTIENDLTSYFKFIFSSFGLGIQNIFDNVYSIINEIETRPMVGSYASIRNLVLYDISSTAAYLSGSGTLMIVGLAVVDILIWIRRKGMLENRDDENSISL